MGLTCWQDAGPGDRGAGVRVARVWMLPAGLTRLAAATLRATGWVKRAADHPRRNRTTPRNRGISSDRKCNERRSMRRVVLVAVLAVVTALVLAVGSAGAAQKGKLSGGKCFVEGKAKFAPALGGPQKKGTEYAFASARVGATHAGSEALECTGTASGKEVN